MRAMSLRPPLLAVSLCGSSAIFGAACGSGPTEGPKSADPGIIVGGVPGSTMAKIPQEQSREVAGRPRAKAPSPPEESPANEPVAAAPPSDPGPDPMNGQFTIAQAAAGLPEKGAFVATIRTSKGDLKCRLFDDKAPLAVANFIGLARGTRPFREKGKWLTRAAYDGTSFHRVIKGFMIQGGDPTGTGRGEPGYTFKDELWQGAKHDRPGLLCMANRGPDTNGMQFFITDESAPHLDRSYTIFGECSPVSVVHAIANVPTDASDHPEKDVTIDKVEISRGSGGASSAVTPPPGPPSPARR
jgi:peptidyl-prolyl cis-trans isomerase A (cyclophilin A)